MKHLIILIISIVLVSFVATEVNAETTDIEEVSQPILVVTDSSYTDNLFNPYMTEILKGEGFFSYEAIEKDDLMQKTEPGAYVSGYKLVLLCETDLNSSQQQIFRNYVQSGGKLIAMRPDESLADMFGLEYNSVRNEQLIQYFAVDPNSYATSGATRLSLQYHGQADEYSLDGAKALAYLYNDIDTPSNMPAIAMNNYGNGTAIAYSFDLAKSIVLMRQGNPDWKDTEGDGLSGYRPSDTFHRINGDAWFARERLDVPQADEAQRILSNIIVTVLNKPIPRMWYLPSDHDVIMINTGDGESNYGYQFDPIFNDASSYGANISIYIRETGVSNTGVSREADWRAEGHEVGIHAYYDQNIYSDEEDAYGSLSEALYNKFGHWSRTCRNHTIEWTGWIDMAEFESDFNTRLDLNYYHLVHFFYNDPSAFGFFTGSALAQKFMKEDGTFLDIYQLLTELPDEGFDYAGMDSQQAVAVTVEQIEKAERNGYYAAFVNNIHPVRYGIPDSEGSTQLSGDGITYDWVHGMWAYCREQNIPLWSAEMYLDFILARNSSTFDNFTYGKNSISFDFQTETAREDLTLMLPATSSLGTLEQVNVDGVSTSFQEKVVKGIEYGIFSVSNSSARIEGIYSDKLSAEQRSVEITTANEFSSGNGENIEVTNVNSGAIELKGSVPTGTSKFGFEPPAYTDSAVDGQDGWQRFFSTSTGCNIFTRGAITGDQSLLLTNNNRTTSVYKDLVDADYKSIKYKVRIDNNGSAFDSGITSDGYQYTPVLVRFDSYGNVSYYTGSTFPVFGSYSTGVVYDVNLTMNYAENTWSVVITEASTGTEIGSASDINFATGSLGADGVRGFYVLQRGGYGRSIVDEIEYSRLAQIGFEPSRYYKGNIIGQDNWESFFLQAALMRV